MTHRLLNIAHRGGNSLGPENSLQAIEAAVALGVDAVEIDLWALAGKLWVTHDRRLGRALPGQGLLQTLQAEQLAALRLPNGEPLPQLHEVYNLTRGRCLLNIEIKGPDTAPLLCEWIARQLGCEARAEDFLISSFDQVQLLYCMQRLPDIRRALLVEGIPLRAAELCTQLQAYSFNPSINFINRELVREAHRAGMKTLVYTVNHPEDWQWLYDLGVDGVFTDVPEQLKTWVPSGP
ncbi:glycerophosphodiester phosphodiesterase [Simiduia sp. 21SJ11W-1]|uniref:glycerophosphodiester phosphodiesterase n=1 Tax=Simiduia sp. 21SJ11W-1 TaxID=2909669 RepID=UPI00209F6E66|nr:glycerophosphodiester phosphodiesterase [Simiduia sp. 21SJ11W-1]UTA48707.1 glycerophosphodiester phosphodiesterase [Simiduia sp. 21SJ11W-1]